MKKHKPYPRHRADDTLPEGIYPPIQGYTHESLIDEIGQHLLEKLLSFNVDPQLARETLFSTGALINKAFEEKCVEYMIARYVSQPDGEGTDRAASIENMANEFSSTALGAITEAVADSPLVNMLDKQVLAEMINGASDVIYNRIMKLKQG